MILSPIQGSKTKKRKLVINILDKIVLLTTLYSCHHLRATF